jgi:topoisomerase-4 subunit A
VLGVVFKRQEKGHTETVKTADISFSDRYSNGSFILDEDENGKVTNVWKIAATEPITE